MILKNFKSIMFVPFLAVGSLTACGSEPESYTADFLYENNEVREQVLEDCKANKQTDDNCKNANEANNKKSAEEYAEKAFR